MSPFLDPSELLANAMLGCLLKGAIEDLQNEGWQPEKPKIETTEKVLYLTDSKSGKLPVWQKNRSTENFYRSSELHQEKSVLARQTQTVELDFSSRTASDQRLFLQRDPLGYVDGMGLYTYVRGNPINFVDPMGLELVILGSIEELKQHQKRTGDDFSFYHQSIRDDMDFPARMNEYIKKSSSAHPALAMMWNDLKESETTHYIVPSSNQNRTFIANYGNHNNNSRGTFMFVGEEQTAAGFPKDPVRLVTHEGQHVLDHDNLSRFNYPSFNSAPFINMGLTTSEIVQQSKAHSEAKLNEFESRAIRTEHLWDEHLAKIQGRTPWYRDYHGKAGSISNYEGINSPLIEEYNRRKNGNVTGITGTTGTPMGGEFDYDSSIGSKKGCP
tara:strand:+ start:263 stop:1417 length:1155 start_codon:yes stop_codon:yes gene_type:complete